MVADLINQLCGGFGQIYTRHRHVREGLNAFFSYEEFTRTN
jgi:hypothetical protein